MISLLKLSKYDFFESIEILKNLPDVNKLSFPNQSSTYNFNPDDFEFIDRIFGHQQSVVECYTHTPTQIELAIKFVRIPHDQQHNKDLTSINRLQTEIEAHKKVSNSSTIVGFYGFCVLADHILICMELMDMSLRDFYLCMHKEGNMINEDTLYVIISSVLNALMDCKKMSVMHRDIKPLNILLNSNGEIKLCDFGLARILDESKASTFVGTFAYWPPERFSAEVLRYDFRAEIWSLGITILEVICGKLPYPIERGDFFIFQNAIKTYKFDLDALLTNYSDDLKAFIDYCLKPVLERPSLDSEVFSEKYTRIISSNEYIETIKFFGNSRKRKIPQRPDSLNLNVEPRTSNHSQLPILHDQAENLVETNFYDVVQNVEKEENDKAQQIYQNIIAKENFSTQKTSVWATFKPSTTREHCLKELLDTETNYVENALQMILTKFYEPLRSYLRADIMEIVFINIKEIATFHQSFSSKLRHAVLATLGLEQSHVLNAENCISDVFISTVKQFTI